MDKKLKTRTTHIPFDQKKNAWNGGRQIPNFKQVFRKKYENRVKDIKK